MDDLGGKPLFSITSHYFGGYVEPKWLFGISEETNQQLMVQKSVNSPVEVGSWRFPFFIGFHRYQVVPRFLPSTVAPENGCSWNTMKFPFCGNFGRFSGAIAVSFRATSCKNNCAFTILLGSEV